MSQTSPVTTTISNTSITGSLQSYKTVMARIAYRLFPTTVVLVTVLLLRSLRNQTAARLGNEQFATGYALACICVLLILLGLRKRILTVELGRVAVWQRTHHYLGLLSVGAYALHAGVLTTGWFESILAITFWAIALSGVLSWYINRTSPRMLRAAGGQILRHDIPAKMREVREQAYQLALSAAGKSDTASLADHFGNELSSFFTHRRSVWYRLSPTGIKRRRLLLGLENIDRYLSEDGRKQREQMSSFIQAKDDLDFQSAIQNRVRLCAAMHTWLLGAFCVMTLAHILIAHRFVSNW